MKKRILSIVLTLCMVLMLCPVTALAEGTETTYVGTEEDLRTAIEEGKTFITLTADFTIGTALTLKDKEITLDLNGHVLTKSDGYNYHDIIKLEDSSASGITSLTLIDSNPTATHEGYEVKGGLIYGKIVLTVVDGGQKCYLYANGGSVLGPVGFQSAYGAIYCTSNTPTAFYSMADGDSGGSIYGGIFYGSNNLHIIQGKTITFMDNGGLYAREVVESGKKAVAPIEPASPNGEKCLGWYADGESTPYDFSTSVTENITLTAKWFEDHDLEYIPAKAPTPTEDGNIEYWVCKNCGKWFADEDGKEEITDKSSVIVPGVTVEIPFTTTVKLGGSTAPGKTTFELEVVGYEGMAIGAGDVTVSGSVTTNGAGDYDGVLTITGPEETLWCMLSDGVFVQQVNAGEPNWTYDDTVWSLKLRPIELATDYDDTAPEYILLICPATLMTSDNGSYYVIYDENPVDEMQFTNIYTSSGDTTTIVIGGEKEESKPVEENPNTGAPVAASMSTISVLTVAAAAVAVLKMRKH